VQEQVAALSIASDSYLASRSRQIAFWLCATLDSLKALDPNGD
jgi:hypothetical protein